MTNIANYTDEPVANLPYIQLEELATGLTLLSNEDAKDQLNLFKLILAPYDYREVRHLYRLSMG